MSSSTLHQAAQKAVEVARVAFEHWYSEAGRWPKSVARGEDGHYLLAQANSSYEAWRAAVAALQQQPEPVAAIGWLYDWTHSSALGKPDEQFTSFTTDEAHARKHDNPRSVYTAPPALQQQEVPREPVALTRESLADIVRAHLGDVYICTRVWNAWNVGTMGQDDFEPADESSLAEDIADAVLAASPSTTRQQEVGSTAAVHLTADEISSLMMDLSEHDGSDFESECPSCTAFRKLASACVAAAPSTPEKAGGVALARTYLHVSRVDALIAVMEGECDGLAVTRETAEVILRYLDGNAPPVGVSASGPHPLPAQANDGGEHG